MRKECGGLFKIFPEEQFFDYDDNPEIYAPKHEIPACTVPKSGEHPNDCGVKQGARKSAAVAAEGNVDVLPYRNSRRNRNRYAVYMQ